MDLSSSSGKNKYTQGGFNPPFLIISPADLRRGHHRSVSAGTSIFPMPSERQGIKKILSKKEISGNIDYAICLTICLEMNGSSIAMAVKQFLYHQGSGV